MLVLFKIPAKHPRTHALTHVCIPAAFQKPSLVPLGLEQEWELVKPKPQSECCDLIVFCLFCLLGWLVAQSFRPTRLAINAYGLCISCILAEEGAICEIPTLSLYF